MRAGNIPIRIYAARGGDTRTAVLFFHGLRSSGETLDAEARAFAAAGITAIVPDAPHHGARRDAVLDEMPDTATRAGYAMLLRILRETRDEVPLLVDHALGLGYEQVAIGGVSMGAYIALAAGIIEPRLAAVVSLLGSPDWTPREGEAAASAADFAERERAARARAGARPPPPAALREARRGRRADPSRVRGRSLCASGRVARHGRDGGHFPRATLCFRECPRSPRRSTRTSLR